MASHDPSPRRTEYLHVFRRRRLLIVRLCGAAALALVLFSEPVRAPSRLGGIALDVGAGTFVVFGVLGRLWSLLHISGNKRKSLVTSGPYALCRNPLYVFSFFMGIGAVMLTRQPILLVGLLALFFLYYPFVILAEEDILAERFPSEFERYRASVPRVLPRLSWRAAVEPRGIERGCRVDKLELELLHASWYLLLIPAALAVRELHAADYLPELWRVNLPS